MKILNQTSRIARAGFLATAILISISGCATFDQLEQTRQAIKASKFELRSVDARIKIDAPRLNSSGIVPASIDIGFNLGIRVDNRFGRDLPLNRLDIKLYADDELVATGTTKKYVVLSHSRPTAITAFVGVEPAAATYSLVKRLKGNKIHYRLDGVFYFKVDQFEIPVSMTLKKA